MVTRAAPACRLGMEGAGAMTRGAARSADRAGAPPATVCESEPNRLRCGAPEDGKENEKDFFLRDTTALLLDCYIACDVSLLTLRLALLSRQPVG